ncbi:hypothetical protein ARMSODRAFT_809006 [Armillaria solidipes]|uniref:Uncharacterized protein n=1 Tax=Armillaria solidipes TaxID=1076256 RepID=A0A2H3AJL7_9AGAR|nr:hypothetical protein ARMSODRAFT_809006 [Armillaria solidipes]
MGRAAMIAIVALPSGRRCTHLRPAMTPEDRLVSARQPSSASFMSCNCTTCITKEGQWSAYTRDPVIMHLQRLHSCRRPALRAVCTRRREYDHPFSSSISDLLAFCLASSYNRPSSQGFQYHRGMSTAGAVS